jgi:nitrate reductase gamma subunit
MFRAALAFMVLGLIRHAVVTLSEVRKMVGRAGNKNVAYRQAFAATMKWLFPVGQIRQRFFFSITSLLFHVAIIVVPIFLAGHIALWKSGIGLSWPAISNGLADVLTFTAVATAVLLVVQRAVARDSRALSRFNDYALPLLIAVPFVSGFLVMHPTWNPFSHNAALLVHVMSANLLLILIPVTKLSHIVLLPATQLVSELGWHFPPDAGKKVGLDLGKEGQPI